MCPTFQNQRHKAELVNIFSRTKIQHANPINEPPKWTSTCRMQHNEECDEISHGIRIGGLFENSQKAASMRTALAEMGHQQPPTPVAIDNTAANSIVNETAKPKKSQTINMRFYWVRDIIRQNHFHIFWGEGKRNLAGYVTKKHPIWHHRTKRPRYVKPTQKYIENSKDRQTGTGRGCALNTKPQDNPETVQSP